MLCSIGVPFPKRAYSRCKSRVRDHLTQVMVGFNVRFETKWRELLPEKSNTPRRREVTTKAHVSKL